MADNMQELKDMRIWMLWHWKTKEDGSRTKVPMSVSGGPCGTDEKWQSSWATYVEAAEAQKRISNAAGIGFKIPEGYYFIDIDHRELTDPLVKTIFSRHESYAEYSVSGTGIHQYGKCDFTRIPTYIDKDGKLRLDRQFYQKNPHNDMELYIGGITNRFAVYTGNVIEDKPLRECTTAILTTLDKDMRRKAKEKFSAKRDGSKADFDIVCNLRKQKNGEKFSRLYDEGDWSAYNSQSEADAALCAMIAFRTGPDPTAIDELFRGSALMRDKWERDDYRQSTIEAGLEACHGVFHKSKMEHPDFIKFNLQTGEPYVSVPLLAKYVREHLCYVLVRDNGKQGLLKYVYQDGCYRLYADNMLMGVIKQYIADYDVELVKMGQVSEALSHIVTDLNYVSQDDLNANEDLINFRNGLLRITEHGTQLLPHSPEVLSTIQIPCEWKGIPSPNKTIAGICRRFRHLIGLTREKVAEETGLNLHDIVRAETGEENFSLEKLRKLADYYGVSMETLLSGNPEDIFGRAPDGRAREESRAANARRAERAKEIGDIGEELSYRYEISRHMKAHSGFASEVDPSCAGRKRLGYDILSRELDGSSLMIESKASRGPDKDDFHMSKREMERMREAMEKGENYLVYHWRNAESENPRLEILTPNEVFKMYDISVETYYLRRS